MSHHAGVDATHKSSFWASKPGYKPILLLSAAIVFTILVIIPPPRSMIDLVGKKNPAGYKVSGGCSTITDTMNKTLDPKAYSRAEQAARENKPHKEKLLTEKQAAQLTKIMLGIFFLAVFFWATEALPLGATDLLVAVMLYLFTILPMNEISKAFMQDAVFFIFGILVVAVGVAKTGLDKRIGLILLSRIKSAKAFAFLFLPALAMAASFLSEHALVALLVPVLMGVYKVTCKMYGVEKDKALAVFLLLGICFAANHGGPGSPAAGGRNAIMMGYFTEYGAPMSFLEWMKYGMPFVPVTAMIIGAYMYIRLKSKFLVKDINPSEIVKSEVAKMPKFAGKEAMMTFILICAGHRLDCAWGTCRTGRSNPVCRGCHVSVPYHRLGRCSGRRCVRCGGSLRRGLRHGTWSQVYGRGALACKFLCRPASRKHIPWGRTCHWRKHTDGNHDKLHERRGNGRGPWPHCSPHGGIGQCKCLEIRTFLCFFLVIR